MSDISELAEMAGVSLQTVYRKYRKLGRMPTLEEAKRKSYGRPKKYTKGE